MNQSDQERLLDRIAKLIKTGKLQKERVKELEDRVNELNAELTVLTDKISKGSLKKGRTRIETRRFEMVTVLYAVFEGFEQVTKQENSEHFIDVLDNLFIAFEDIASKYKLVVIRKGGNDFVCVGGVPEKNITNPVDVGMAALEMQHLIKLKSKESESNNEAAWNIKIGMHSGTTVAEIRGSKKAHYDLRGELINIANRLANGSELGKTLISDYTFELLKGYFTSEFYGSFPVKYLGNLEVFQLKRLKPAYSSDRKIGVTPNEVFKTRYLLRQFVDLQERILNMLEKKLPDTLFYHNVKHTIDVVNQAELIGYGEGVDDEKILLLITAALFHDTGHVINSDNHESHSCDIAREMLPEYNYTTEMIDEICGIIMATQLPPTPSNLLEEIICDSDLDYLGRADFIPISNTLYEELKVQNKIGTLNDWNKLQVKFLKVHQFFTRTSQKLREVNKQKQIDRIKALITED